jgi:Glycosyl transferase family 90
LIFSQAKALCLQDFLLPMSYHWGIAEQDNRDDIPFSQKISAVVWRGSNTGTEIHEGYNYRTYQRLQALEWEINFRKRYPDRVFTVGKSEPMTTKGFAVDFGLNQLLCPTQGGQDHSLPLCMEVKERYPLKPSFNSDDLKRFKYLLMLDGNSWPSRLQSFLQYNSVILYSRVFFDWYSWYLIPYKHFVPLRLDLGDLEEKLMWLEANPEKAKEIIRNAHEIIKVFNRHEQMQCHAAFAMVHFQDLV